MIKITKMLLDHENLMNDLDFHIQIQTLSHVFYILFGSYFYSIFFYF